MPTGFCCLHLHPPAYITTTAFCTTYPSCPMLPTSTSVFWFGLQHYTPGCGGLGLHSCLRFCSSDYGSYPPPLIAPAKRALRYAVGAEHSRTIYPERRLPPAAGVVAAPAAATTTCPVIALPVCLPTHLLLHPCTTMPHCLVVLPGSPGAPLQVSSQFPTTDRIWSTRLPRLLQCWLWFCTLFSWVIHNVTHLPPHLPGLHLGSLPACLSAGATPACLGLGSGCACGSGSLPPTVCSTTFLPVFTTPYTTPATYPTFYYLLPVATGYLRFPGACRYRLRCCRLVLPAAHHLRLLPATLLRVAGFLHTACTPLHLPGSAACWRLLRRLLLGGSTFAFPTIVVGLPTLYCPPTGPVHPWH